MKQLIKSLLLFIFFSVSIVTAQAAEPIWIDVRTVQEHAESSISGHPNIPHEQIDEAIAALVPDKSTPVYLYCASGRRAGIAKDTLEQMGYTGIINVGGIDAAREKLSAE